MTNLQLMYHHFIKLLALFLILASCGHQEKAKVQDEKFQKDGNQILLEVSRMIAADQDARTFRIYGTTDSVEIEKMYSQFAKQGLALDSVLMSTDTSFIPPQQEDSIQTVIDELQTKHTRRLIEILKEYGYPKSSRLTRPRLQNVDPFIVFHHPDISYKSELTALLKTELLAGRIDSNTYETIMWDLNERKGVPNIKGVTFVVHNKDGTVDTIKN